MLVMGCRKSNSRGGSRKKNASVHSACTEIRVHANPHGNPQIDKQPRKAHLRESAFLFRRLSVQIKSIKSNLFVT